MNLIAALWEARGVAKGPEINMKMKLVSSGNRLCFQEVRREEEASTPLGVEDGRNFGGNDEIGDQ